MVLDRLEALPVGRFHYKLLSVTGLGWLFDSMDTGLIAFILPVLAKEWQLAPGTDGAHWQYWPHWHGFRCCRLGDSSRPYWPEESIYDYSITL